MACNCGKRHSTKQANSRIASASTYPVLQDVVIVRYIGDVKDTFYGVISGNRYVVSPGDVIEIDKADAETKLIHKPGLLENGLFVLD